MLSVLGLAGAVEPVFMAANHTHRFVFESEGRVFDLPCGVAEWRRALLAEFPGDRIAVDRYFDRVETVRMHTPGMDLSRLTEPARRLDEDSVSLAAVLDGLTDNALLKAVLCGLGMCHGVKPSEISFASHARVCFELYESTARLRHGGESLIDAFADRFKALDVDVRTGSWITACGDVTDDRVTRFELNTGEEVSAGSVILTIHPRQILELLPRGHYSKAFAARVEAFEPSAGFFTVYGTLDDGPDPDFGSTIVSLFPSLDFEAMLSPDYRGEPALVIVGSLDEANGAPCRVVTAFEPSFFEHVAPWKDSLTGRRPPGYAAYKADRVAAIRRHLGRYDRRYEERLRVLDSASILTFRDYLHSPEGAAYGIKQKVGQYNLIGKLPIRNFFAAGQSSLLPGLMGAMMSSFVVTRLVLGRDTVNRLTSTPP